MNMKQKLGMGATTSILVAMALGVTAYYIIKSKDIDMTKFLNEFKVD